MSSGDVNGDRQQLHGVTMTAFVGHATKLTLDPPRDYQSATGEPGRTNWILDIGDAYPQITLHVKDPAKLWELHDLIAATLPPREDGAPEDDPLTAQMLGEIHSHRGGER